MRIIYTESFPNPQDVPDADATLRLVRKMVEDRLAAEILKQIAKEKANKTA